MVTYDVVVKVDNSGLKLKPGMTANISIIVSSKKDVLRIPNTALRFRLSGGRKSMTEQKEKGRGVWVLENKKPKKIKIETGISDGNYTELLSGKVGEGQELLVESLAKSKGPGTPAGPRMF